jgi:hypothetical protein
MQEFLFGCFFALFGEFFFAFFSVNENIVRIADFLFPALPCFPVAVPVVKFKLVQVFEKFLVEFCLKLLGETRKKFGRFRFEQSGLLQGLKVLDDSSKGHVEGRQGLVNLCLLVNIRNSHCAS